MATEPYFSTAMLRIALALSATPIIIHLFSTGLYFSLQLLGRSRHNKTRRIEVLLATVMKKTGTPAIGCAILMIAVQIAALFD